MPVILNNKNMAISYIVYQNKDDLDIFSDKDYPKFILMNSNVFFLWIFFHPKKTIKQTNKKPQGKYLDATY